MLQVCISSCPILAETIDLLCPLPAPAPPLPPPVSKLPLPATPAQLIRGPVLKASPSSPLRNALDTIASDGALPAAVASTAEAAHLPELFRSVLHTDAAAQTAVATLRKKEEVVKGLVQRTRTRWRDALAALVEDGLPKGMLEATMEVREWWTRERVHKRVEASLPNRQLDVLVIDGKLSLSVLDNVSSRLFECSAIGVGMRVSD